MENKERILVIDDEPQIRRFLKMSLETANFNVQEAENASRGIEMAVSQPPTMVILDLGLPDKDGLEVLKSIREWSQMPVIILSARDEEETIIKALDLGADDYLTKPFSAPELMARIRVCLRKVLNLGKEDTVFTNGELEVDLSSRIVKFKEKEVSLTSTEYDLLKVLVKHAGKVLTHRQLLKEVWGPNSVEHTQYLRVYTGHLRQKIENDPAHPKMLITEPGVGYRLKILEA